MRLIKNLREKILERREFIRDSTGFDSLRNFKRRSARIKSDLINRFENEARNNRGGDDFPMSSKHGYLDVNARIGEGVPCAWT